MSIRNLACVCYEVNRAICIATGDESRFPWSYISELEQKSTISGIEFALENPGASINSHHEAWMAYKIAEGWVWGVEKNEKLKTHPDLVPYDQLTLAKKTKYYVFRQTVFVLSKMVP